MGRLFRGVKKGTGTAEIWLADGITVVGAASVSAGENTLDVKIADPVLRYSPRVVDDGSFGASTISVRDVAVSFEVDLELLPVFARGQRVHLLIVGLLVFTVCGGDGGTEYIDYGLADIRY